jgi:DNA primase
MGEGARFAHAVVTLPVKRDPAHPTQEFSKVDRGGCILVDTANGLQRYVRRGYAVRAKPGAPCPRPARYHSRVSISRRKT